MPGVNPVNPEGGVGYERDPKGELFLLAVSSFLQDSFYELQDERTARLTGLVRQVAVEDGPWMLQFLRWLRAGAHMRTLSLVAAAEVVAARLDAKVDDGVRNRELVDAVLARADEPGELLAYWISRHGRNVPKPVKRGLADSVRRLYDERALLKWDSNRRAVRFGDVVELVHPKPGDHRQEALFRYAIDRRHDRPDEVDTELLPVIAANARLRLETAERPEALLDPEALHAAGMTWEDVLSLAGTRLDKKTLWESVIPHMGYMAMLRNLRNIDEAGVSDEVAQRVAARIADPAEVARSRQLPMRFLAAHRAVRSLRWGHALEKALQASLANVPVLTGSTLVLVDQSASMFWSISDRSRLKYSDSAAVFGAALACRNPDGVTLVQFGSTSHVVPVRRSDALLRLIDQFNNLGGTDTAEAVRRHYDGHDRVVIVTDEQAHPGQENPGDLVPGHVPVYTFNLVGYQLGHQAPAANRVTIGGGLTDAAFQLLPLLEQGCAGAWPWEV